MSKSSKSKKKLLGYPGYIRYIIYADFFVSILLKKNQEKNWLKLGLK